MCKYEKNLEHDQRETNENKKSDLFELSYKIVEIEGIVEKVAFLLGEFDKYDYDYEVTPYKALQYARNESKEPDCELSFEFCMEHSRIVNLYRIISDYAYEAKEKLNQLCQAVDESIDAEKQLGINQIPAYEIPMMSDDRWNRLAYQQRLAQTQNAPGQN